MPNSYFTYGTTVSSGTTIQSSKYNTDFQAVETGFETVETAVNKKVEVPDSFTGNVKIPEKTLTSSVLYFNASGDMDVMAISTISTDVAAAAASAAAAATSEANAATSETNAAASAAAAAVSETNAAASATSASDTLTTIQTTYGGLTTGEVTQLNNINGVTISNTQWSYLGLMDQGVATTDNFIGASFTSTGLIYAQSGMNVSGGTWTSKSTGTGGIISDGTDGLMVGGAGSTNAVALVNGIGTIALRIPNGTDDVVITDNLTVGGSGSFSDATDVTTGSAGAVTAPTTADDLVVEGSGSTGISILAPDANNQTLNFGCPSDNDIGLIQTFYNAGSQFMRLSVAGSEQLKLESGQATFSGSVTSAGLTNSAAYSQTSGNFTFTGGAQVNWTADQFNVINSFDATKFVRNFDATAGAAGHYLSIGALSGSTPTASARMTTIANFSGAGTGTLTLDVLNAGTMETALSFTSTKDATFAGDVTVGNKLFFDPSVNGVINTTNSCFINIDTNNNTNSEVFVVGKDADSTSSTRLFEISETGDISIPNGSVGIGISPSSTINQYIYNNNTTDTGLYVQLDSATTAKEAVLIDNDGTGLALYVRNGNSQFDNNVGIGAAPVSGTGLNVVNSGSNSTIRVDNGTVTFIASGVGTQTYTQTWNGANTAMLVGEDSTTNRSINAGGTLNANGADYAEYVKKSETCGEVQKGDVIGFDVGGKVTDKFSEAKSFAVKSTAPSLVGGDVWAVTPKPEKTEEMTDEEYQTELDAWEIQHEAERATVDRIAFCGVVPVNGAPTCSAGQHLIVVEGENDSFNLVAKDKFESFDDMDNSIGRVKSIGEDGRPIIIVKVG